RRRDPRSRSRSPANSDTPLRIVGASGSSNGADTGTRASGISARGLPASADDGAGRAGGIELMGGGGSCTGSRLGAPRVFGHRVPEAGPAESPAVVEVQHLARNTQLARVAQHHRVPAIGRSIRSGGIRFSLRPMPHGTPGSIWYRPGPGTTPRSDPGGRRGGPGRSGAPRSTIPS